MNMSDLYRCKHTLVKLVVIVTVAALAACGGGSNGPKTTPTPIPDTTPNSFTFTAQTDQPVSTQVESNAVTIAGINQAVAISVEGGEYSIADADFTAAAGTIRSGQTLALRGLSSSEFETESTVTVRISSVSRSFSITTAVQDVTPESFDLGIASDAVLGVPVGSAFITVRGITGAVPVSITNGTYTIDGGTATSDAGTIENGQEIQVQVTAAATFSTEVVASLTLGDFTETFSVTTLAEDTTPDTFTFTQQTDVDLSTQYTSNEITVTGINSTAALSITGGEYAINSGDFVSTAGTVQYGDTVAVRLTSASLANTAAMAELTIGGVVGSFSVVTLEDTTPPTASIAFPPPISKTENTQVTVRGEAADDISAISDIKIFVNDVDSGVTVASDDEFATWSASLPLVEGDNSIEIVVTDAEGNTNSEAAAVSVKRDAFANTFPHDGVEFGTTRALGIDISEATSRIILPSNSAAGRFVLIDLNTGVRTEQLVSGLPVNEDVSISMEFDTETRLAFLCNRTSLGTGLASVNVDTWEVVNTLSLPKAEFDYCYGMTVDRSQAEPRLLFTTIFANFIGQTDLSLSSYTPFSSNTIPDTNVPFSNVAEVYFAPGLNRIFAGDLDNSGLFEIDPETGARTIFSSVENAEDDALDWAVDDQGMALDVNGGSERLLWVGPDEEDVIAVDLASGKRTVFSAVDPLNEIVARNIATDESLGFALIVDLSNDCVAALDLITGERVIISKARQN